MNRPAEYYESNEFYSKEHWFLEDLPEDHPWFDLSGELQFATMQLDNITIVENDYKAKNLKATTNQLVLNSSKKVDIRAINATNNAKKLLPIIRFSFQNRALETYFIQDWGEFMNCMGAIRQRLNIQSNKRETSGKSSRKSTSKLEQRYWVVYWLINNCNYSNDASIKLELNILSKILYQICTAEISLPCNHPIEWFAEMLDTNEAGKVTTAFNGSFNRIGKTEIKELFSLKEVSQDTLPPTDKSLYPK